MRDVEKWLMQAPNINAPDNFLDRLMERIAAETVHPATVKPALPTRNIGFALLAAGAAVLAINPFMKDIHFALRDIERALRDMNLPGLLPILGGR